MSGKNVQMAERGKFAGRLSADVVCTGGYVPRMRKMMPTFIAMLIEVLACAGIARDVDFNICFVSNSSVGRWNKFTGEKVANETTDICFVDNPCSGQWNKFTGQKTRNESIDVCFVNSPSAGQMAAFDGNLARNPTLNIFLSPQKTSRTYNVTISSPTSAVGSKTWYCSYEHPTENICFVNRSSVGRWNQFTGEKMVNPTIDICICDNPSIDSSGQFLRGKTRNPTTDIYIAKESSVSTVDIYIDGQATRKQLVAILFKIGVLTKEASCGVSGVSDKSFNAEVIDVHDGDTITVEDIFRNQVKVFLAKIDAPELNQIYGQESRRHLCDLIKGKTVRIDRIGKSDCGSIFALVYDDRDTEINLQMVKDGYAWHFKKYDQSYTYSQAETNAKLTGKGMWIYGAPTPPWEWRKVGYGIRLEYPRLERPRFL